jgi:hypothetical protein
MNKVIVIPRIDKKIINWELIVDGTLIAKGHFFVSYDKSTIEIDKMVNDVAKKYYNIDIKWREGK